MDLQDRIKVVIQLLIGYGVADNQGDVGALLGYNNKSYFSQIVNGKVPLPADFLHKLAELDARISKEWLINEFDFPVNKQVYKKRVSDNSKDEYIIDLQKKHIEKLEMEIMQLKNRNLYLIKENLSVKNKSDRTESTCGNITTKSKLKNR